VIHLNIKPSNVLFDRHWNAKLSDMGLGKLIYSSGLKLILKSPISEAASTNVGMPAFIDPEYLTSNKVSISSDVYSFGMLLLHMISGSLAHGDVTSRDIAEDALAGVDDPFVDKTAGEWPIQHALAFAKLALQCADGRRRRRPDIETEVLPTLEKLCAECPTNADVDRRPMDHKICVVCMDAPTTHAFMPCGHLCVCEHDAGLLSMDGNVCPLCRAPTNGAMHVY